MDRRPHQENYTHRPDKRGYRRPPSPEIKLHHWDDDDLSFFLTGEYDMTAESPEVQIMLDLASKLSDARYEWALAQSRLDSVVESHGSIQGYREPRHAQNSRSFRRGFDVGKQ